MIPSWWPIACTPKTALQLNFTSIISDLQTKLKASFHFFQNEKGLNPSYSFLDCHGDRSLWICVRTWFFSMAMKSLGRSKHNFYQSDNGNLLPKDSDIRSSSFFCLFSFIQPGLSVASGSVLRPLLWKGMASARLLGWACSFSFLLSKTEQNTGSDGFERKCRQTGRNDPAKEG